MGLLRAFLPPGPGSSFSSKGEAMTLTHVAKAVASPIACHGLALRAAEEWGAQASALSESRFASQDRNSYKVTGDDVGCPSNIVHYKACRKGEDHTAR